MSNFYALQWLSERGAMFALPKGRTKDKFEKDWPNKPHDHAEAIAHAIQGNNVGILTGKHSNNIIAIDRDIDFPQTCEMLGQYAKTAKIARSNAQERGKLLYRINGDLPPSNVYKVNPTDKHPACEFLSDGRHALAPTSLFNGGEYTLIDMEDGIQELTVIELDYIWRMITGESIHKDVADLEAAQAATQAAIEKSADNSDYVASVKAAWTSKQIFEHFKRATHGTSKSGKDTRILGNAGLLVMPDGNKWFCHADGIGGGPLEAWAYCKWKKKYDSKMFWDVINDMATAAGIAQPERKTKVYTNGSGPTSTKNNNAQAPQANTNPTQPATQTDVDPINYRAEDGGILDAWLDHYGNDWLFVSGPDQWRYWFDTHWKHDDEMIIGKEIIDLMDDMNHRCSEYLRDSPGKIAAISERYSKLGIDIPESAIKEIDRIKAQYEIAKKMHNSTKRSSSRVSSVEIMARKKRALSVTKFDVDESLNLANGVLSLKSLELRPHERDDMFTYCLDYGYEPTADCPLFKKFISEVLVYEGTTTPDPDLANLFQELLGYSLTPDVKHEVMIWMFGDGSNGKSVAISILEALLGPMALSIDFQTVGTPGNYDLSDVPGKRVLFSTEAEKGKTVAEGHIKRIVTGDTLSTRPIYGSPMKFKSTAKIWWAMNDRPIIRDTTDSMWRRMKLIPFFRKFVEGSTADPDLTSKLMKELPGILNWALDGLVRLKLNNKFSAAAASETAKAEYREEANPVAQWMKTMTVPTGHPATLAGALFDSFRRWCEQNNERPITATQFGRDLTRLKVNSQKKMTGKMYNLALIDNRNHEQG